MIRRRNPIRRTALASPTLEAVQDWQRKPRKKIAARGRRAKRELREWELAKVLVRERSGGFCEIQWVQGFAHDVRKHSADHVHHILPRGRGGKHLPSNLVHVCSALHDWIHANPALAESYGLLRRSGDIV